jgi:hypothetical protein
MVPVLVYVARLYRAAAALTTICAARSAGSLAQLLQLLQRFGILRADWGIVA